MNAIHLRGDCMQFVCMSDAVGYTPFYVYTDQSTQIHTSRNQRGEAFAQFQLFGKQFTPDYTKILYSGAQPGSDVNLICTFESDNTERKTTLSWSFTRHRKDTEWLFVFPMAEKNDIHPCFANATLVYSDAHKAQKGQHTESISDILMKQLVELSTSFNRGKTVEEMHGILDVQEKLIGMIQEL